jgi:hypothetical protein
MGVGALRSSVLVVIFAASSSFCAVARVNGADRGCAMLPLMLVQTVIQAYSPAEFRGGPMAIFHMTQGVLIVGAMLAGALST